MFFVTLPDGLPGILSGASPVILGELLPEGGRVLFPVVLVVGVFDGLLGGLAGEQPVISKTTDIRYANQA